MKTVVKITLSLLFIWGCSPEKSKTKETVNKKSSVTNNTVPAVKPDEGKYTINQLFEVMPDSILGVPVEARSDLFMRGVHTGDEQEITMTEGKDYIRLSISKTDKKVTCELRLWRFDDGRPLLGIQVTDTGYRGHGHQPDDAFTSKFQLLEYQEDVWKEVTERRFPAYSHIQEDRKLVSLENWKMSVTTDERSSRWKWNGDSFKLAASRVKGTRILTVDFDGLVPVRLDRVNTCFQTGRFDSAGLNILYPAEVRDELFSEYTQTNFQYDQETIREFEPIEIRKMDDLTLFLFKAACYEFEGIEGVRHIIRMYKDGRWIRELSYMTGASRGANVATHEASFEWLIDGFLIRTADAGVFPILEPCVPADLDMDCKLYSKTSSIFIKSNMFSSPSQIASHSKKVVTAGSGLKEKIDSSTNVEALFTESISEDVTLSREDEYMLKTELYKTKAEITGAPVESPKTTDFEKVLAQLKEQQPGIDYRQVAVIGQATVFSLSEDDKNALLLFNTLNEYFRISDYHEELLDNLKDTGLSHFSLITGEMRDTMDISGDGIPEFIIRDVSTFRTAVNGTEELFRITRYGELIPAELYAPIHANLGDCEHLQGEISSITFTETGVKITDELGGHDCDRQDYQTSERYYTWSLEDEKLERIKAPESTQL